MGFELPFDSHVHALSDIVELSVCQSIAKADS
jgi:hypothetical protein